MDQRDCSWSSCLEAPGGVVDTGGEGVVAAAGTAVSPLASSLFEFVPKRERGKGILRETRAVRRVPNPPELAARPACRSIPPPAYNAFPTLPTPRSRCLCLCLCGQRKCRFVRRNSGLTEGRAGSLLPTSPQKVPSGH